MGGLRNFVVDKRSAEKMIVSWVFIKAVVKIARLTAHFKLLFLIMWGGSGVFGSCTNMKI